MTEPTKHALPVLYTIRAAIEDIEAAVPKLPPGETGYRAAVLAMLIMLALRWQSPRSSRIDNDRDIGTD